VHLHCEFARGQQNQNARLTCWLAVQPLDHRNQKRQCLAGAGLGGADYVFAFKGKTTWIGG
jgi:hypothetical protein